MEVVATALLAVALCGAAGVLLRGIFFNVLVGGGGGATGPKELMGWVGVVADGRVYPPPTPRFTKVAPIVLQHIKDCFEKS